MIPLILIGNGGHAVDILQIIRDINHHRPTYDIIGSLDDSLLRDRLGDIEDIVNYPKAQYVICVNDGKVRKDIWWRIARQFKYECPSAANLIHPTAYIGDNCVYGEGLVMGPYSVLTTKVHIGRHVHLNSHASVNQNSHIGSFCTLSPGARVCGDCDIGTEVNMGANSVIINVKRVGDRATIGAGAVVIRDVEEETIVIGVPAKPMIKSDEVVWG